MIKQQLFIGAALIAGVAAGYFMRGDSAAAKPKPSPNAKPKVEHRGRIPDAGLESTNEVLRRRVAELEKMLAEMKDLSVATNEMPVAESAADHDRPRSPKEMFEQMKKADPERFAQMTNHMARFFRRQQRRTQNKLDFLDSIDISGMSAEAQRTHQRLQDLLVQRENIRESIHNLEANEEEQRANFEKMMSVERELHSVRSAERKNLLAETAKTLGLSGETATAFSSTIEQVFQATGNEHGMPMPPPGEVGPGPRR